jgi:hypothetical protein
MFLAALLAIGLALGCFAVHPSSETRGSAGEQDGRSIALKRLRAETLDPAQIIDALEEDRASRQATMAAALELPMPSSDWAPGWRHRPC